MKYKKNSNGSAVLIVFFIVLIVTIHSTILFQNSAELLESCQEYIDYESRTASINALVDTIFFLLVDRFDQLIELGDLNEQLLVLDALPRVLPFLLSEIEIRITTNQTIIVTININLERLTKKPQVQSIHGTIERTEQDGKIWYTITEQPPVLG